MKEKMWFSVLRNTENNEIISGIYTKDGYMESCFSPVYDQLYLLNLNVVKGKTYQEKKRHLENKAIEYSNIMPLLDLSYYELAEIQNYFYKYGKKYGLLKEFRENGIC